MRVGEVLRRVQQAVFSLAPHTGAPLILTQDSTKFEVDNMQAVHAGMLPTSSGYEDG